MHCFLVSLYILLHLLKYKKHLLYVYVWAEFYTHAWKLALLTTTFQCFKIHVLIKRTTRLLSNLKTSHNNNLNFSVIIHSTRTYQCLITWASSTAMQHSFFVYIGLDNICLQRSFFSQDSGVPNTWENNALSTFSTSPSSKLIKLTADIPRALKDFTWYFIKLTRGDTTTTTCSDRVTQVVEHDR